MRAAAGSRVGRYELIEQVGRGSYGVVFRAKEVGSLGRIVAVKLVSARMGREGLELALREARALDRLIHPAIGRVHDAGIAPGGVAYVVFDFVTGPTLLQWCRDRSPPLAARLSVLSDLCAAIQHAHERGTIHRDIKPSNLMIADPEGTPRGIVIDFGVAEIVHSTEFGEPASGVASEDGETAASREHPFAAGTIETMAPEQLVLGALPDARSDIYSIGATVHWAVCGRMPFGRLAGGPSGLWGLVERIRSEPVGSWQADRLASGVTAPVRMLRDLETVVRRTLEKRAELRYRSVAELRDDLERVRRGEVPDAAAHGVRGRSRRFMERHRLVVAITLLAFVALLASTAVSARFAWSSRQAAEVAQQAQSDQQKAVEALRSALRAIIKDVNAIGDAPELLRHWPSVIEAFSLTYGPTHGLTLVQRKFYADGLLKVQRVEEALREYRAIEEAAIPEDAEIVLAVARVGITMCLEQLDRPEEALSVLERSLREDFSRIKPCDVASHPWSARALHGRLLCTLGRVEEGIRELEAAVDLQRRCFGGGATLNDVQARTLLAEAQLEHGRAEEGMKGIESLLAELDGTGTGDELSVKVWKRRLEVRRLVVHLQRAEEESDRASIASALREVSIDWMRYVGIDMDALGFVNRALELSGFTPLAREEVEEGVRQLTTFGRSRPTP